MEAHGAVGVFAEETVEDDEVEVEVGIERGTEAMQEGDRTGLGILRSAGRVLAEQGSDGAQQDAQHGAGGNGVMRQEGTQALGQGEDPLAQEQRGQDVVAEVRGDLHHAAGVAGGADAASLAGEGDEASGAAEAGEAVGEDAAGEVGAEVVLGPAGNGVAAGLGAGEEGFEVVLDDGMERGGGSSRRR